MFYFLEESNIGVVSIFALALPWSEVLLQGGTHVITSEPEEKTLLLTPPGKVAFNMLMYNACR